MVWWRASRSLRSFANRRFSDIRSSYVPFEQVIKTRQSQARRSVLVQVNSELSFTELHSYCSQFGSIQGVHHYTLTDRAQNFMLVEFDTEEDASRLIASACFANDADIIPVQSPFLWFRAAKAKKVSSYDNKSAESPSLAIKHGCHIHRDETIKEVLLAASSVSEQIQILYDMTRLNDLGTRLRFLTARQIECAFMGLFPKVSVYPFGSSVNGFGKMGCDLDLVMKLTSEDMKDDTNSRLVFHVKKAVNGGRYQQQRYMEIVSDMLQLFVPGCSHVRRILQARIPIIKYNQDYTDLECDLSMSSLSGLYMSEILYMFGCFDSRVKPLVFAIRKWAQFVGLTNPSPGKWITNFPLTLMVLFFLQNAPDGPIIPSYNYLKSNAGKNDVRITEDGVDCSYCHDIADLAFSGDNRSSLEELLTQFFHFYSNFDFSAHSISINEGKLSRKMDYAAVYIINPLEVALNVSKNVSHEECERLKVEARNALWNLESAKTGSENWGLCTLIHRRPAAVLSKDIKRMVVVKDLFEESKETDPDPAKGYLQKNIEAEFEKEVFLENNEVTASNKYEFKNDQIENQVNAIKNEYAETLKDIRNLYEPSDPKNDNTLTNRRKVRRR